MMSKLLIVKICILFVSKHVTLLNAEENYLNIDAKHFESNKEKNILYFYMVM